MSPCASLDCDGAGKELRQAFKRDELNISNIDKLQDDMADIMVGWLC